MCEHFTNWQQLGSKQTLNIKACAAYLHPNSKSRFSRHRIKFILRSWIHRRPLKKLWAFLSTPVMQEITRNNLELLDKPLRPYLFAGTGVSRRVEHIMEHYRWLSDVKPGLFHKIYHEDGIELGKLPEGEQQARLVLHQHHTFRKEGEMVISLLNQQDQRLYSCAFSLIGPGENKQMVLTSLQGPEPRVEHPMQKLKDLTKQCFGVRPKSLVVETALYLAKQLEIDEVLAVRKSSHVYMARRYKNKQGKAIHSNYDELWVEFRGAPYCKHLLRLQESERKELDEIKSKKRAMYRRRYLWLDELKASLSTRVRESLNYSGLR
ncbi:VirK/YbjX family protein [Dongshaea marina]|uniref:VirK/YbjX family protein n=1 Tax=Dongshaea marina TaxID=2047966 RepID=UPI00131F4680|nr:DUF535 family protein [Dongshaea marina]